MILKSLARLFTGLRATTVICVLGEDEIPLADQYTETVIVTPYALVQATGLAPPKFTHQYPLSIDVVIIYGADRFANTELSLVIDALPDTASIYFIGDEAGLKPYGSGQPFMDLSEHPSIPSIFYTQQKESITSPLEKLRHTLRKGQQPVLPTTPSNASPLWMVPAKDDEILSTLIVLLRDVLPSFQMTSLLDITVYMLGTKDMIDELNSELQLQLNPYGAKIHIGKQEFFIGDPVVLTRWDRYNNLCAGTRLIIDELISGPKVIVTTPSGHKVTLEKSVLNYLSPAYVQAPYNHPGYIPDTVIFVVPDSMNHFLWFHQYYHAVRLAGKRVILIGQADAFNRSDYRFQEPRHTGLIASFERHNNELQDIECREEESA